jgi:UDP-hydrolysing UDP-N-acetyl-D-glucosamine 2-epimerase
MKRKIAAVTVARSDYSLYLPIFDAILAEPSLELQVIAAAAHLSDQFGRTIDQIRADGYPIAAEVEITQPTDDPTAVNKTTALGIERFGDAYDHLKPDLLLLLGDRYEMHAAGVAAIPHLIPIAHIHGGEESAGAIDNVFRHSLTKISHLHFASTELHAQRIIQMGEHPDRVFTVGAPGLDRILSTTPPSLAELCNRIQKPLTQPYILATFHPVTTEPDAAFDQAMNFLRALQAQSIPTLLTMPNADTGGLQVRRAIQKIQPEFPHLYAVENLGPNYYLSAMKYAALMAGNSSSGIIEAASFNLSVVNVGNRQQGRAQSGNVINCEPQQTMIEAALGTALSQPKSTFQNIYGDGQAAQRIVNVLTNVDISTDFVKKSFFDQAIIREG